jgi:hypothetical protein
MSTDQLIYLEFLAREKNWRFHCKQLIAARAMAGRASAISASITD